jgi:hypothetical protein
MIGDPVRESSAIEEHPVELAPGRPQKAMACPTPWTVLFKPKNLSRKCRNSRGRLKPAPLRSR